ncbi:glutathione S-transferase family protein [Thioalkalivibrio sp.]|uniref:glutathione S-transferase family protein n=1 Tax=Thioalkalivibrio sp. TaxID=2093813 RepID=UPI0012D69CC1|nr:glutathione S-transferase family protein [Thioalkalivibrio sp.]TVP82143.1 MAG: glutathione S-transferase family protein [Thioalkalivibrio sp.]
MTTLYYFPHTPQAQRLRLALGAKQVPLTLRPVDWFDDETFFELGIARQSPVLQTADGTLHTDTTAVLAEIDRLFPEKPALRDGIVDDAAWSALLDWRAKVDAVLERLYAPLAPGFHGIGDNAEALADFKAGVRHRFGMTLEELANDRYDGFAQFTRLSRLPDLARHLTRERFYLGQLSVADCMLAADLYPLQMHDGINLPVDMLYYLRRVEEACQIELNQDWLAQ